MVLNTIAVDADRRGACPSGTHPGGEGGVVHASIATGNGGPSSAAPVADAVHDVVTEPHHDGPADVLDGGGVDASAGVLQDGAVDLRRQRVLHAAHQMGLGPATASPQLG